MPAPVRISIAPIPTQMTPMTRCRFRALARSGVSSLSSRSARRRPRITARSPPNTTSIVPIAQKNRGGRVITARSRRGRLRCLPLPYLQAQVLAQGEVLVRDRPEDEVPDLLLRIGDADRHRLGLHDARGDLEIVADQKAHSRRGHV